MSNILNVMFGKNKVVRNLEMKSSSAIMPKKPDAMVARKYSLVSRERYAEGNWTQKGTHSYFCNCSWCSYKLILFYMYTIKSHSGKFVKSSIKSGNRYVATYIHIQMFKYTDV